MPLDYSINMNPWMSSGMFGTADYYMPSMMGMGYAGIGAGAYGAGLNGAYATNYATQMLQYQRMMEEAKAESEKFQAQHASDMHQITADNTIKAYDDKMNLDFDILMRDSDIQQGIRNLEQKILAGDGDGVCEEYDKLEDAVKRTFEKNLGERYATNNVADTVRQHIEHCYSQLLSVNGETRDLEADLNTYLRDEWSNGFHGGMSHAEGSRYKDQVIRYIYGRRVEDETSKNRTQKIAKGVGATTRSVKYAGIGAAAGAVGYAGVIGGLKVANYLGPKNGLPLIGKAVNRMKFTGKGMGRAGAIVGGLVMLGDLAWQWTH